MKIADRFSLDFGSISVSVVMAIAVVVAISEDSAALLLGGLGVGFLVTFVREESWPLLRDALGRERSSDPAHDSLHG